MDSPPKGIDDFHISIYVYGLVAVSLVDSPPKGIDDQAKEPDLPALKKSSLVDSPPKGIGDFDRRRLVCTAEQWCP